MRLGPKAHLSKLAGIEVERIVAAAAVDSGGATKATFVGSATVNGEPTRYRIVVEDNADSGGGADRFSIATDSGYAASGSLTAGNIQVHE